MVQFVSGDDVGQSAGADFELVGGAAAYAGFGIEMAEE
jgi:hypothetical protein